MSMTGTPAIARRLQRRLTIGMATYDDYDGVYFTIQALRMYHHEVMEYAELVVIDNHPDGACANSLRALARIIHQRDKSGLADVA